MPLKKEEIIVLKWKVKVHGKQCSDLEWVEQQVTEEADEPQHWTFRDRLIDNKGEEDGVNPEQRNESQSGLCQSEAQEKMETVNSHKGEYIVLVTTTVPLSG